ncbi:MAG: hypothetical protein K2N63_11105, partial [Lachnospiraceae bacterium]|nr:hypothetical protein [Lachnospiraceae bacterium]
MMDKNMKSILKWGFESPPPVRKEEFLYHAPFQRMRIHTFFWTQAGYIRKWIWVFSIFLFFAALIGCFILKKDILWEVSAFM